MAGVHGGKLLAALESDKLPVSDITRLEEAIARYHAWIKDMDGITTTDLSTYIVEMVSLLNA